jgi:hypothetical protein
LGFFTAWVVGVVGVTSVVTGVVPDFCALLISALTARVSAFVVVCAALAVVFPARASAEAGVLVVGFET